MHQMQDTAQIARRTKFVVYAKSINANSAKIHGPSHTNTVAVLHVLKRRANSSTIFQTMAMGAASKSARTTICVGTSNAIIVQRIVICAGISVRLIVTMSSVKSAILTALIMILISKMVRVAAPRAKEGVYESAGIPMCVDPKNLIQKKGRVIGTGALLITCSATTATQQSLVKSKIGMLNLVSMLTSVRGAKIIHLTSVIKT